MKTIDRDSLATITGGDGSLYDQVSAVGTRIVNRGMQAAKEWAPAAMVASPFITAVFPKQTRAFSKLLRAAGRYEHAAHAAGAAGSGVVIAGMAGAGLQTVDEIRGRGGQ